MTLATRASYVSGVGVLIGAHDHTSCHNPIWTPLKRFLFLSLKVKELGKAKSRSCSNGYRYVVVLNRVTELTNQQQGNEFLVL